MTGAVILLVEPEQDLAEVLEAQLRSLGYAVHTTGDGSQIPQCCQEYTVDLILLDAVLLGAACQNPRGQEESRQSTPILVLLRAGVAQTRKSWQDAGAYGCLRVPFSQSEAAAILEMALERARAEQMLRENQARWQWLFDASPVPLWVEDASGVMERIEQLRAAGVNDLRSYFEQHPEEVDACAARVRVLDVNRKALELHSAEERGELLGSLERVFAEESRAAFRDLLAALAEGKSFYETEAIVKALDGEKHIILLSMFVESAPTGRLDYSRVMVSTLDITQRKVSEDALHAAARMEASATLAGGVAHEFNNLMSIILGNIALIRGDLPFGHPSRASLHELEAAAERAGSLTKNIMAFVRGGRHQPVRLPWDETIRKTVALRKGSLPQGITLEQHYNAPEAAVEADPNQAGLLVLNILNNAAEAIEGSGYIRVDTSVCEIDRLEHSVAPGLAPGTYVCLKVSDTGKGMAEEVRRRMFEPFFTTKFQGRGIGLSAAYGIAKNQGGGIFVDSIAGEGTAITVYLAACSPGLPVPQPAERVAAGAATAKTILVVDDEKMILSVMEATLKRMGFRVLSARNGKEALETLENTAEDVVLTLLDLGMPVMDGIEAFPKLKVLRPAMKILIFSGFDMDQGATKLLEAGANGFLQKPASIELVQRAIRNILGDSSC